jgi:hypothetical protein
VPRRLPHLRRSLCGAIALPSLLTFGACRTAIATLDTSSESAAAKTDDLFGALAVRFGAAYRDPRFERIRPRMVRHALTPSRLYPDTAIWTSTDGEVRTVSIAGALVTDRYMLTAQAAVPRPDSASESRHLMHLRRLGESIHRWDSTDELAVGTIRAAEVFALLEGALRGAEQPGDSVRADLGRTFPRTTAMLGRLFVLDTLRTSVAPDGSHLVALSTRLDANRMRPFAPLYADYIDEYLEPLRIEAVLIDAGDRPLATAHFRRNRLDVRARSRDGTLQPLAGQPPQRSDSLRLRISFFARVLFFDVGATNIIADVVPRTEPNVRGWTIRFRREPQWHFPLAVGRLLRAPLRRPFAGDGTMVEYIVRDSAGGQTLLTRNIHIVVQESAIVRWLGALGATAMGDLSAEAEREKDRYVGDVFRAMGEDARVLLGR